MDLSDVLTEPSIIDHSWWKEGLVVPGEPTFDPAKAGVKNPNNVKNELAIEWGTGGPDIPLDEPAGVVERHIPPEDQADAGPVILFARDLMNQGIMGDTLVRNLKAKFDPDTLRAARKELGQQLVLQGIVGCIAVDGRGYESCQAALAVASMSPYKRFIKYVIGCECGDHQMLPKHAPKAGEALLGNMTLASDMENVNPATALDSFLSQGDSHETEMTPHCRSTMLPVVAARGDLDPSEMDSTLVELMNVTGLPEDDVEKLRKDKHNDKYSSVAVLQAAFRMIDRMVQETGSGQYVETPEASDCVLARADNEIELASVPMGDIPVNHLPDQMSVDVEAAAEPELPVEMRQFEEPEFEGTDVIAVDEAKEHAGDLDIQMSAEMTI